MLSSTFKPGTIDSIGPDGQPANDGVPPGWELKVEGQLLEKVSTRFAIVFKQKCNANALPSVFQQPGQPNSAPTVDHKCRRKFSTFFKSLVIELDHELYGPDNHLVEWHRTSSTAETDGFQVRTPLSFIRMWKIYHFYLEAYNIPIVLSSCVAR